MISHLQDWLVERLRKEGDKMNEVYSGEFVFQQEVLPNLLAYLGNFGMLFEVDNERTPWYSLGGISAVRVSPINRFNRRRLTLEDVGRKDSQKLKEIIGFK